MEFQQMIEKALTVRKYYEDKEKQLYGSPWTTEEIMLGFLGDVGNLAKLVLAENGNAISRIAKKGSNMNSRTVYGQLSCYPSITILTWKLHF